MNLGSCITIGRVAVKEARGGAPEGCCSEATSVHTKPGFRKNHSHELGPNIVSNECRPGELLMGRRGYIYAQKLGSVTTAI